MPYADLATSSFWSIGAIAALAGAFAAMVGVGGGVILVPVLIAFFNVDTETARAASLVAICATSLGGSLIYLREGAADLVAASYLQLPTTIGAIAGALIGSALNERSVKLLFAILLLYVGFRLLFSKKDPNGGQGGNPKWAAAIAACAGGGVLSAMLGLGGGLIFVPVLSLLLNRPPRVAAATSTFMIGLTAAAGALIYFSAGQVEVDVTIPAALGVLVGAQAGARLSRFVPGLWLRRIFAFVMWGNALLLLNKVIQDG